MTRRGLGTGLALAFGLALLHAILVMPAHPAGLTLARLGRPIWELPAILLALALFPGPVLRGVVVALAIALMVLRSADLGTYLAFSRPFNPLLDLHLLGSGWSLLASSVGQGQALAAVGGALGLVALTGAALWICLSRMRRVAPGLRGVIVVLPLALAGLTAAMPGWAPLSVTPIVRDQVARIRTSVADLAAFTATLEEAPAAEGPAFAALEGRDVILAFVESYGRSFVEAPEFAPVAGPRLAAVEDRLAAAGWQARSGWLAAPTRGGQSWLAHATLLSGLWVDSQLRYDRLMTSDHPSLNMLFGAAGWRIAAVMPAITRDWPEAAWYGYDLVLDADALGYAGMPFDWVTMPDQYTWDTLDRRLRDGPPAMIEVALITSHAPWTPLPDIVAWDEIGDGSVFDGTRRNGDSPRAVWSDPERIRAQYALSLDYALEVAGQYIVRAGEGAVFVILGDHQPAPLLTGQDAPPDVPVHVISDDPALLERLPEAVFGPGMVPGADRPVLPMQDLRTILTRVFETPPEPR